MTPATDTIRARLDAAPMSRVQVGAVIVTVLLSALDGYDVLSMTFAAPAITQAWGVGKAALGVVLASGLAGMALGSFILAPMADNYGRKRLVLVSLVVMALGTLLSAFATSLPELSAYRVVTGLGIGTCVAVINPLAAEFANARRRALAVALMALGYPAGGLAGGLLAAALLKSHGWPSIFIAGFVAALLLLPIVAFFLPESPAFLAGRGGSLDRLNAFLARCGQQPVSTLRLMTPANERGYAAIFAAGEASTTLQLALVNALIAAVFYYTLSWLPQMVGDAGFDPSQASTVSALASLAGIGGCLAVGLLGRGVGVKRLTVGAIVAGGIAVTTLGSTASSLPALMLIAAVCGFFLFGGAAGFYGTLVASFADAARASGSGFVIGTGRVSSAVAPLLAGWLFAAGLGRAEVSAAFGALAIVGAVLLEFTAKTRIAI